MSWRSVLLGSMLLCTITHPLLAAETRYIAGGSAPLTLRSGPGVEYEAVSRLPHGTEVVLHESWGQWARITVPPGEVSGWVLRHYLSAVPITDPEPQVDMSPKQERHRFARLRRKGVIEVQRSGSSGLLRLSISPLIWYRLTPHQQENFLRRAQRYFGGRVVEMHDRRNHALLARLNATGDVEFVRPPPDTPAPPSDTGSPAVPATTPGGASPPPADR